MTDSTLGRLTDDVWLDTEPVRIVGARLTTTMAVLGLPGGELVLWSPVPMTAARRAAVEALGRVAHLYAPNTFHHLWLGDWAAAFPDARVHAPPGLAKKRPDLRIDRVVGTEPEPAFAGVIEEVPIEGFRLEETALVHVPARTAVVADLVHNIGRPEGTWTKLYTQAGGFYDRVALSRVIRWTAFSDRRAARASVDALLACSIERLVVAHGDPIESDARSALSSAYAWLR